MFRQVRKFSVFLGLALLCLSCTRLPRQASGTVAVEMVQTLQDLGSVPAAWGNLVSAGVDAISPQITRLFFQDEEGAIRVVFYDSQFSQLWPTVGVIRRQ